jgi:hypothetical protein
MRAVLLLPLLLLLWRIKLFRRASVRGRGRRSHTNADGSVKRAYRTKRAAARAARNYQRDFGDRMSAYRCRKRWHWHIGHTR